LQVRAGGGKGRRALESAPEPSMSKLPFRCAILFALCAAAAPAREVYKCTTTRGVAFQQQPCAAGADERRLTVTDADPPAAAEVATDVAVPATTAAPAAAPQAARTPKPLPSLWLCTNAADGSRYATRNGPPPPRSVPLGMLGYSGKSLAEAYGPGSNHMSSPDAARPPIDTSPQSSAAASYTVIQDACALATVAQTCTYLRGELDSTSEKLSRARFKDERARLQQQADGLVDDIGGC
jgi:hypothetical protein